MATNRPARCAFCGKELTKHKGGPGRPRSYCNDHCGRKARKHRALQALLQRNVERSNPVVHSWLQACGLSDERAFDEGE